MPDRLRLRMSERYLLDTARKLIVALCRQDLRAARQVPQLVANLQHHVSTIDRIKAALAAASPSDRRSPPCPKPSSPSAQ